MSQARECHTLVSARYCIERAQRDGTGALGRLPVGFLPGRGTALGFALDVMSSAASIHLLLVDDHAAFRLPLAMILEREPDLVVVAQAGSLAEARAVLAEVIERVDVALIELRLPDGDGMEIVRDVRMHYPRGRIVVLTAVIDRTHHARAIDAGAAAVLSKAAQPDEIVACVRCAGAVAPVHPPP